MKEKELSDIGKRLDKHARIAKVLAYVIGTYMSFLLIWLKTSPGIKNSPLRIVLFAISNILWMDMVNYGRKKEWLLGIVPPLLLSAVTMSGVYFYPYVFPDGAQWQKILFIGIIAVTVLFVVFFAFVMICMAIAARNKPKEGELDNCTLVVLGSRLVNGTPLDMLIRRLEKALAVMEENPQTMCILSGGAIEEGDPTEAKVMAEWMMMQGADPNRLIVENRSRTTYENICFSKALAEKFGLPPTFAIVTDSFHQRRVALICRDNGVKCRALNSRTPFSDIIPFWFNEVMCLVERFIKYHK
ncbi:MAG: YdcF family protein [Ruminococcaceae bacterium]|nr:YdcF family protein [Oscillospiraceae bacterium]